LGIAATAAAGLPMWIAATVLALQRPDLIPGGDFAVDEIALMRSTHFAQLVGNYSRFGWSHLGPAWFYALDFVYAPLGQHSWSFVVAALALHALAACLIVAAAWRIRGPYLAAIAALMVLAFVFKLGPSTFSDVWPPYEVILPIVLVFLLAAFGAAGSTLAVVGALLAGSYEAQLHVGTAPTIAVALGMMVVIRLLGHRWPARTPLFSDIRGRRWMLALLALGLVTLVAMWVPVLVDQLTGHPGNLRKLARFFFFSRLPHHPLHEGIAALGRHLTVFPFGHKPPLMESDYSALTLERALAVAGFMALSGALAAAGTVVRDRFAQALGAILFVVTIVLAWSISRAVGDLWSYFLLWTTTLPLVLGIGWAALVIKMAPTWLPKSFSSTRVVAPVLAAVLVLLTAVQSAEFLQVPPPGSDFGAATRAATTLVDGSLTTQPREPVLVTIVSLDAWPVAAGVTLQLIKLGWPVSVRPEYAFMFGEPMRESGQERLEVVFVPESAIATFDQHAAGLTSVGAVPTCGTGCTIYVFTRTPPAVP
jgi:hypothetical protein